MARKIVIIALIVLLIGQLFQPPLNSGNALSSTDIYHAVTVQDSIRNMLQAACFDCHSNHTNYPWYSKVTPVNWWLNHHIEEGKRELNFSTFAKGSFKRKSKKLEETAEQVKKHEMPLDSYLWIHRDARLTESQRKMIVDWALSAKRQVLQDSLALPAP